MIRRYLLAALAALVLHGSSPAHAFSEAAAAHGVYIAECRDADGNLKWAERIDNTVVTVGKNLALDTYLAGSSYTVTGPFLGLISNASFSAVSASDTMSSHAGWLEAGNANAPTYTGDRKTVTWSAASNGSKTIATPQSFAITSSGGVRGAFLVFGTGAVATKDNTSGTLYSAGEFSGGSRTVNSGDTVSVSFTGSL